MPSLFSSFADLSPDAFVGWVRIAFGLIFAVKLGFTLRTLQLNFGHQRPTLNGSSWPFYGLLGLLASATACLTVGFLSEAAALAHLLTYATLYRYSSFFSLEDNLLQSLSLYLVLAGPGAAPSVDAWLGLDLWGRLFAGTAIPELALTTMLGIIFLSAGVSKLQSPMWRRGLGVYYFFLLPHMRRWKTGWLTRHEGVMRVVNAKVFAMQLALLPALLLNAVPVGLVFWVLVLGFAVAVSTIFVFTWLGEAMIVALLAVLPLLLAAGTDGLAARWVEDLQALSGPGEVLVAATLVASLLAALLAGCVHDERQLPQPWMRAVYRRLRWIGRFVWGFIPAEVFTEIHLQGPLIVRTFIVDTEGREQEIDHLYRPDGRFGKGRTWRPTYVPSIPFKLAEVAMELDATGTVVTPARRTLVENLARLYTARARRRGIAPERVVFKVKQLVPPAGFAGADEHWYQDLPWQPAFTVACEGYAIEPSTRPILRAPTGRDLARVTFEHHANRA